MRLATIEEIAEAQEGDEFILDGPVEGYTFRHDRSFIYEPYYQYSHDGSVWAVRFMTHGMGLWIVRLNPRFYENNIYTDKESPNKGGLIAFLNNHK